MLWRRQLTTDQRALLNAMAQGATLKVHRYLDGAKVCRLHPMDGGLAQAVDPAHVEGLKRRGLIESNKKFPAATYWLTDGGRRLTTASCQAAFCSR